MDGPNQFGRGVILTLALTMVLVASGIAGVYLLEAKSSWQDVRTLRRQSACLCAALSTMERVKFAVYEQFRRYCSNLPSERQAAKFGWFDTSGLTFIGTSEPFQLSDCERIDSATVRVTILGVQAPSDHARDVGIQVHARIGRDWQAIVEVVRFESGRADPFDGDECSSNDVSLRRDQVDGNRDASPSAATTHPPGPAASDDTRSACDEDVMDGTPGAGETALALPRTVITPVRLHGRDGDPTM